MKTWQWIVLVLIFLFVVVPIIIFAISANTAAKIIEANPNLLTTDPNVHLDASGYASGVPPRSFIRN